MEKLLLIVFLFSFGCARQNLAIKDLETTKNTKVALEEKNEFVLVVRTASGCGYSLYGLKKIKENINCEKIKVLVVDTGTAKQVAERYGKFPSYEYVLYSELPANKLDVKLFPQFFLYSKEGSLIWHGKGYNKLDTEKILALSGCSS